jgi:hypothetical protein
MPPFSARCHAFAAFAIFAAGCHCLFQRHFRWLSDMPCYCQALIDYFLSSAAEIFFAATIAIS